jgi:dipeptidyl aminopeptidase/acylaminoacyl peptidase
MSYHSSQSIKPAIVLFFAFSCSVSAQGLHSQDLYRFRAVGEVKFAPDGKHLAYTVNRYSGPRTPSSQIWIMDMTTRKSIQLGNDKESTSHPRWSPDGNWIAYTGGVDEKRGLTIAHADGSSATFLAKMTETNSPLPGQGESVAWSPDSRTIAFVSAVPGPETQEANGDPMVITRYLYKPTASEGMTHFNDNRRLHLFSVELASKKILQLTSGNYDEHSIDWSPNGRELLFESNREPNADEFFNYDVFALNVSDGAIRRITATESSEYAAHWSPDGKMIAFLGTRRGLTDRETTMEDTHAWIMDADGGNRREIGSAIDQRQQILHWSPEGDAIYFAFAERGSSRLARIPIATGQPEILVNDLGTVGDYSLSNKGVIAYAFQTTHDMPELYVKAKAAPAEPLTSLNSEVLSGKQVAEVEPFTFTSNDNKFEVEAFLVKPLGMKPTGKYPMIVELHGGPHGQNGPAFQFKDQVYAAHGWAVLHVNYRGSTGYGQRFADAVFADQDGKEGQDVLYAVSAAVRRFLWIDRDRMGIEGVSYGGQLSDWLITQTNEFKAAIPIAGISNLISYNYMTYYNQYEEMEFGQFLHQGRLMDEAWERSALKHVANVHTPTMLVHGENDPDVPIAEAEQYFVALKDVGVDTIMVRYPREGHGVRETRHQIDLIDRSIRWYEGHFPNAGTERVTNVQP